MASRLEEASPGWPGREVNSMLDAGECREGARRPSGVGWRVGAGELAGRRQRAVLRRQRAGRTTVADGTGGGGAQRTRQRRAVGRATISGLAWMHNVNDLGVLILEGETQDGGDDSRGEGEDHGEARPCPKGGGTEEEEKGGSSSLLLLLRGGDFFFSSKLA